jgi:hypothetical protein
MMAPLQFRKPLTPFQRELCKYYGVIIAPEDDYETVFQKLRVRFQQIEEEKEARARKRAEKHSILVVFL